MWNEDIAEKNTGMSIAQFLIFFEMHVKAIEMRQIEDAPTEKINESFQTGCMCSK